MKYKILGLNFAFRLVEQRLHFPCTLNFRSSQLMATAAARAKALCLVSVQHFKVAYYEVSLTLLECTSAITKPLKTPIQLC